VALGAALLVAARKLRRSLADPPRARADGLATGGYGGSENLEAMEAALNYNAFLVSTVRSAVRGAGPVLDFGAGTGTHTRALRDRGVEVWCVEPDAELRRRLEDAGFRSAASPDTFAGTRFGTVYTLNVLEHIDDDVGALRSMRDVAAPGGAIVVYVPAFPILYSAMDAAVGHVRRYRRRDLVCVAERAGLRVTRTRYVDSLGFAAALVYRVAARGGTLSPRTVRLYDRFVFPVSRALDSVLWRWIGKNVLLEAERA
jgi:SAM-dependent methyltransferase